MSFKIFALSLAFCGAVSAASFSDVPSCAKWCVKVAISESGCEGYAGTGDASCMCSSYSLTNSTTSSSSSYSSSSYLSRSLLLTPVDYAYAKCMREPGECTDTDLNNLGKTLDAICFATDGKPVYECGEIPGVKQADLYSGYSGYSDSDKAYYSSLRDSYTSVPSISTTTIREGYNSPTTKIVTYAPQTVTLVGITRVVVYSTVLLPMTFRGEPFVSTQSIVLFTATCPYSSVIASAYSSKYYSSTYNLQTPSPHSQVTGVAQAPLTSVTAITDSAGSVITSAVVVTPTRIVAITQSTASPTSSLASPVVGSSAVGSANNSSSASAAPAGSAGRVELGSGLAIWVGLAFGGVLLL